MDKSSISKLANSTFTSQFFQSDNRVTQQCILPIQNNRVDLLHSIIQPAMLAPKDNEKPLLLHTAFLNSPASAIYLLCRGSKLNASDADGKTVFHMCAYTGHVDVLKAILTEIKLTGIKKLNEEYTSLLTKNNYKRTDAKGGHLKTSVSEARQKIFTKMQDQITYLYQNYVHTLLTTIYESFAEVVSNTNRNCFHLASLNRYQRCYNTMEYMFEALGDIHLHIDHNVLDYYGQVNACFHREEDKTDPRLFTDTVALVEQFILPSKLDEIKKNISRKVDEKKWALLEAKDKDGKTPLFIASKDGCTAIINLIRKYTKSKDSEDKEDLIKIACHNLARSHIMDLCDASKTSDSKTMNFLLSCGQEINKKKTIFGTFALLEAIKAFEKSKNLEVVRMLILSGADINEQDTNGWTVLHHACERGLIEVLQQIFKIWSQGKTKKVLINKLTNKNYHILHLAAMNNHPATIQLLMTSPHSKKLEINGNAVDGDKCTMLHHAAKRGSLEALTKILELCPDLIYQKDIGSNTALHYAAMNDHTFCIKYLLYCDGDYDKLQKIVNSRGKLARDLTVNKKPFENSFSAARSGDVNQIRKMVSENPSLKVKATPIKNRTLLIFAVLNQHLLVAKFLIEAGADQSHKDSLGKTAKNYAEECLKNAKNKQEQVVAKNIASLLD